MRSDARKRLHEQFGQAAVTTVEWNVLDNGEPYLQPWTEDEDEARSYSNVVTGPLVLRARISYPDYVSPWSEAP